MKSRLSVQDGTGARNTLACQCRHVCPSCTLCPGFGLALFGHGRKAIDPDGHCLLQLVLLFPVENIRDEFYGPEALVVVTRPIFLAGFPGDNDCLELGENRFRCILHGAVFPVSRGVACTVFLNVSSSRSSRCLILDE